MEDSLNIKICKYFVSNKTSMSNIPPLEVVERGGDTQPQVVEYLNKITQQDKGLYLKIGG